MHDFSVCLRLKMHYRRADTWTPIKLEQCLNVIEAALLKRLGWMSSRLDEYCIDTVQRCDDLVVYLGCDGLD